MNDSSDPAAADDSASLSAWYRRMNDDADRRLECMKRDGCCGELDRLDPNGFCSGIGICPTWQMAQDFQKDLFGKDDYE